MPAVPHARARHRAGGGRPRRQDRARQAGHRQQPGDRRPLRRARPADRQGVPQRRGGRRVHRRAAASGGRALRRRAWCRRRPTSWSAAATSSRCDARSRSIRATRSPAASWASCCCARGRPRRRSTLLEGLNGDFLADGLAARARLAGDEDLAPAFEAWDERRPRHRAGAAAGRHWPTPSAATRSAASWWRSSPSSAPTTRWRGNIAGGCRPRLTRETIRGLAPPEPPRKLASRLGRCRARLARLRLPASAQHHQHADHEHHEQEAEEDAGAGADAAERQRDQLDDRRGRRRAARSRARSAAGCRARGPRSPRSPAGSAAPSSAA